MVSDLRSVIAVSLNVGGGVRLIKPAKLYTCTQNTTNTTRTDARRRCVRQWFRTSEPLEERRYENWNTHTYLRYFLKPFQPGRVAQSVGHLTRKSGVLGFIPGLATYFRSSFRFFKKGSCQLLAKVCARSTG